MGRILFLFSIPMLIFSSKAVSQLVFRRNSDTVEKKITLRLLPQNFYSTQVGYFCKKEVQLQKITALPFFVRLGSKEYVDWMERKPNAIKRNF